MRRTLASWKLAASKEVVKSDDKSVTVVTTQDSDTKASIFDLSVNVDGTTITKTPEGQLKANTTTLADADNDGKVDDLADDKKGNLITAGDVANAINASGFKAKANGDAGELINPGDEVNLKDGKNVTIKRDGANFTVATKDDVDFKTVTAKTVTTGDSTLNSDGLTINNGPSVTKAGINANNTKITNVANGEGDNDAVNVSQLKGMAQNIYNDINYVNNRIGQVDREAKAGIASAMAFEEAPFVPGKWTYAVGATHYGGEQAVAATLRKTADNGRWAFSGGISTASEGDTGFRIGVSGVID